MKYAIGTALLAPTLWPQANAASKASIRSALIYSGAEDLHAFGIERLPIIYEGDVFDPGELNVQPNFDRLKRSVLAQMVRYDSTEICIDIERLKLFSKTGTVNQENFDRLRELIKRLNSEFPSKKFGLYSLAPYPDYWSVSQVSANPGPLEAWRQKSRIASSALAECGVLFTPLYTFYDDIDAWLRFADHHHAMAMEIAKGRDIYFLLWPSFHEGGKFKDNRFVPTYMWERQLRWAEAKSANILLWGGWDGATRGPAKFDSTAEWWKVVVNVKKSSQTYS